VTESLDFGIFDSGLLLNKGDFACVRVSLSCKDAGHQVESWDSGIVSFLLHDLHGREVMCADAGICEGGLGELWKSPSSAVFDVSMKTCDYFS